MVGETGAGLGVVEREETALGVVEREETALGAPGRGGVGLGVIGGVTGLGVAGEAEVAVGAGIDWVITVEVLTMRVVDWWTGWGGVSEWESERLAREREPGGIKSMNLGELRGIFDAILKL